MTQAVSVHPEVTSRTSAVEVGLGLVAGVVLVRASSLVGLDAQFRTRFLGMILLGLLVGASLSYLTSRPIASLMASVFIASVAVTSPPSPWGWANWESFFGWAHGDLAVLATLSGIFLWVALSRWWTDREATRS